MADTRSHGEVKLNKRDIPQITKAAWLELATGKNDAIVEEVLDAVIAGELEVSNMGTRRKAIAQVGLLMSDMQTCLNEDLHSIASIEGKDPVAKMCELADTSEEAIKQCVLNAPKRFSAISEKDRKALKDDPDAMTGRLTASFPPIIRQWISSANMRATRVQQRAFEDSNEDATPLDKWKLEGNEVFEIQLPSSLRDTCQNELGEDDNLKRYVIVIKHDNTDSEVMKMIPKDIEFDLVKGSMCYGLHMFPQDSRHTTKEELKKMFQWIKVINTNKASAAVMLGCLGGKVGEVEEVLKESFCNAGTAIGVWTKPGKWNKNKEVGLNHDIEFYVRGWSNTENDKLPVERFKGGEETRSRTIEAPAIKNKLKNKVTNEAYNATEENPYVRTSFIVVHKSCQLTRISSRVASVDDIPVLCRCLYEFENHIVFYHTYFQGY